MSVLLASILVVAFLVVARKSPAIAFIAIAGVGFAGCRGGDGNTIVIPIVVEQWNGWENLGGVTTSGPDCVITQTNRIDCFTRGLGALVSRHQWDGQHWIGPSPMPGIAMDSFFDSRPECVSGEADHIDCVARQDTDKALFRRTIHGSFITGWEALGGNLSTEPECVTPGSRRLDCFARGNTGALMRNTFDGNVWSGWTSTASPIQILDRTKPSCVIFRGEINCVVVTSTSTLRQFRFTPQGVEQRDMQGGAVVDAAPGVGPSAKCDVSFGPDPNGNQDDQIHCFAPRFGQLGRWNWNGQGNLTWSLSDLGSGLVGDWDCVVRSADRIDCVELLVQGGTPLAPQRSLTTRHRVFETGQSVRMSNVSLSAPSAIPTLIRCLAFSADRIDCFAGGTPFDASPLFHAWLTRVDRFNRPIVPGGS